GARRRAGFPGLGSLKGEPGLFAALPGVVSPRSWQDWLGGPGGPGGLSARAGLASPSEKKAMIRATNTDLRMTLLLLSGGAPAAWRGPWGEGNTSVIPVVQQWSTAIQAHNSHIEQPSACARRFVMISPTWTRHPLARDRRLSGRRERTDPAPSRIQGHRAGVSTAREF